MTTFTGDGYTIYSGARGDVIVREDGVWVEEGGKDTQMARTLDFALDYVKFQR